MNKVNSEELLSKKIEELPLEISPNRDLWQGVERAIQNKPQVNATHEQSKKVFPMAWAASIVAAVLLTWNVFAPQTTDSPVALVTHMQQSFEAQKQAMLISYGQPNLTELPESLQKQLEELASARKAIETALKDDPTNSDLLNLFRWTQEQELELLTKLYSPQWQTI